MRNELIHIHAVFQGGLGGKRRGRRAQDQAQDDEDCC